MVIAKDLARVDVGNDDHVPAGSDLLANGGAELQLIAGPKSEVQVIERGAGDSALLGDTSDGDEPHTRGRAAGLEDEPLSRMMAEETIAEAGFLTLAADGSDQAMRFLVSRRDIRVVFTDIDMPAGLDGLELAILIRDRWPPIEIIVTSGKRAPLAEEMPAGSLFFSKP